MKKEMYSFLCLFVLLYGCASVEQIQPLDTPTGKPEITIQTKDAKKVIASLQNAMINREYSLVKQSENLNVWERPMKDFASSLAYGSKMNPTPYFRVTYTFIYNENTIRIIASIHIVTNPGTNFEQIKDVSKQSRSAHNIQEVLLRCQSNDTSEDK